MACDQKLAELVAWALPRVVLMEEEPRSALDLPRKTILMDTRMSVFRILALANQISRSAVAWLLHGRTVCPAYPFRGFGLGAAIWFGPRTS